MLEQEGKEKICQIQRFTQKAESEAGRPAPGTRVLPVPGANGAGKTTLFGPTGEILSEEYLNEVFGMEVRLYPLTLRDRTYTCILPLGLKEKMERGV